MSVIEDCIAPKLTINTYLLSYWHDGTEVSASGWRSGGPQFQSHPRLTFQSCSCYQLNQLGRKAAPESTFKKSNNCGVSNTRLYFLLYFQPARQINSFTKSVVGSFPVRSTHRHHLLSTSCRTSSTSEESWCPTFSKNGCGSWSQRYETSVYSLLEPF